MRVLSISPCVSCLLVHASITSPCVSCLFVRTCRIFYFFMRPVQNFQNLKIWKFGKNLVDYDVDSGSLYVAGIIVCGIVAHDSIVSYAVSDNASCYLKQ
jgi:hypothetical protein